jgi:hypothetical protein
MASTITDDSKLRSSLRKIIQIPGQFSNLLTANYSAKMTNKDQNGCSFLP